MTKTAPATSFPQYDVWVFATLRTGRLLNGEIDRVSDALRLFARRLSEASVEDRERVWAQFLDLMPDAEADALIEAVAMANPDEPPPEGEAWPPLRLGALPPVEPFPDIVLPETVADFVKSASDAIGCPPDFVGLPVLVVAGAAVGRSASLQLKPGYFVSTSLYGMNIGGPSSGKSPGQEAVVTPMWRIDEQLHDLYKVRKEGFDEAVAAAANAPKGQPRAELPVKPVLESAVLEDCTVEAVAPHLAINPRGLLVSRDEGSAWVASLGQYKNGKGSDRQFWLSALFGKPVRVDRKGNADLIPVRVPFPFLSFVGGMPPDMIAGLREQGGRSDGFVERILFAYPDARPRPYWSDSGIPDEVRADWAEVVRRLRDREMANTDGKTHPEVYRFSPEAKAAWVFWYNAHADSVNDPGFNSDELAMEGKLCDFAARLALILQLMHEACDPIARDPASPRYVSKWAVSGAIKLWSYFRSQHRRVRACLVGRDLGGAPEGARLVLNWLSNHPGRETFTERDLTLAYPPSRGYDRAVMEDGLNWLAQRNAIRRAAQPERPKAARGRRPTSAWEVHPDLEATKQRKQQKQRKSLPDEDSVGNVVSVVLLEDETREGGGDDEPSF